MMRDLIPRPPHRAGRRKPARAAEAAPHAERVEALSAAFAGLSPLDLSLERWLDRLGGRR
jgi:hypothetical protein